MESRLFQRHLFLCPSLLLLLLSVPSYQHLLISFPSVPPPLSCTSTSGDDGQGSLWLRSSLWAWILWASSGRSDKKAGRRQWDDSAKGTTESVDSEAEEWAISTSDEQPMAVLPVGDIGGVEGCPINRRVTDSSSGRCSPPRPHIFLRGGSSFFLWEKCKSERVATFSPNLESFYMYINLFFCSFPCLSLSTPSISFLT